MFQDTADGGDDRVPAGLVEVELFAAGGGEGIGAGAAAGVCLAPGGADPPGLLHAVEGGIEGSFLDAEDIGRHLLDGGHDGVAVEGAAAVEYLEDEKVEGALQGVRF
jgi:hypothetical protein